MLIVWSFLSRVLFWPVHGFFYLVGTRVFDMKMRTDREDTEILNKWCLGMLVLLGVGVATYLEIFWQLEQGSIFAPLSDAVKQRISTTLAIAVSITSLAIGLAYAERTLTARAIDIRNPLP